MPIAEHPERQAGAGVERRKAITDTGGQGGQAAVELVALLPLVIVVAAVLWQIALAGHAAWAAGAAARAAARAGAVGDDARQAAHNALPADLRRGLRLSEAAEGRLRVQVAIPAVTPGLDLGSASADARFPAQRP